MNAEMPTAEMFPSTTMTKETYRPPYSPGDAVVLGWYRTDPSEPPTVYEVVEPPPGTPRWMREKYTWILDDYNGQVRGFSTSALTKVCRHCHMFLDDHANNRHCLYGPTSFA